MVRFFFVVSASGIKQGVGGKGGFVSREGVKEVIIERGGGSFSGGKKSLKQGPSERKGSFSLRRTGREQRGVDCELQSERPFS